MTGKKLVLTAIKNQRTERTPYVPFIGVHAVSLIGLSAEEYLKNGVAKAMELYNPDGPLAEKVKNCIL